MYYSKGRLAPYSKTLQNEMSLSKLNMKKDPYKKGRTIKGIGVGIFISNKSHGLSFGVILTLFVIFHINTLMGSPPSMALGVGGPPHTPGQWNTSSRLIIEPRPGNRSPCLLLPGTTGCQRAGNTNHPDLSGRPIWWVCSIYLECTPTGERSKMHMLALTC